MSREILLGDEAVGLGAIHSGLSGVYAYPGTPSTEIFEFVERATKHMGGVHAFWSTNEKVAYEEALGMSWAGKRALVCMKHVGLNVAADAFMNSAVTGTNGGLVLAVADDPGMHSSQNEQDSRYFAQFALIPCLEPRNQQECYDMMFEAFDMSEELSLPVMVRLVTRIAHSRAGVETRAARDPNPLNPSRDIKKWTLLPSNARVQYKHLTEKQPELLRRSEASRFNELVLAGKRGVITCGIADNYYRENLAGGDDSVLAIRQYPVPVESIRRLVEHVEELLVLEDGYPLVETMIRGLFGLAGVRVAGRMTGELPRTGELDPDIVREALGLAPRPTAHAAADDLANRPPALCKGCPHTDSFRALNEALSSFDNPQVFSDIGCYTLAALPPLEAIHSCVAMGASIGMAAGAAHAGYTPAVAAIGDSTFSHGGITPLLSAVQQGVNLNVLVLDNDTVGMTGTQRSMSTGETLDQIILGAGVAREHLRVITPTPRNHDANVAVIREELAYDGPSVIIARRSCLEAIKKA
ncbi:MAG: thiamine pyrophosphate-dependent enzyme [Thermoanaerobaculales bacterium]|jgi:indolepyruvate ferredoxin oxidoreductase alpha subunit|nr:thiamine pyrophosphate-dependent enzyme [Thermoanaerobaculales bacterium]